MEKDDEIMMVNFSVEFNFPCLRTDALPQFSWLTLCVVASLCCIKTTSDEFNDHGKSNVPATACAAGSPGCRFTCRLMFAIPPRDLYESNSIFIGDSGHRFSVFNNTGIGLDDGGLLKSELVWKS